MNKNPKLAGPEFFNDPPNPRKYDKSKFRWFSAHQSPTPWITSDILVEAEGGELLTLTNDQTPFHFRVDHYDIVRWAYIRE